MSKYHHQLDNLSPLPQKYIDEAVSSNFIWGGPPSFNVDRAETTFTKSNFAQSLYRRFTPSGCLFNIAYYRNLPGTAYKWHIDRKRTCAINILLTDNPNALVMHKEDINGLIFNIFPVHYTKGCPVLFDTTVEHAVYNPDPNPRIILTIGFIGPSYQEMLEFLITTPNTILD